MMTTRDIPALRAKFETGQKCRIHVRKELDACVVLRIVRVIGVYPFFVLFRDDKGIKYMLTYPELLEKKLCVV